MEENTSSFSAPPAKLLRIVFKAQHPLIHSPQTHILDHCRFLATKVTVVMFVLWKKCKRTTFRGFESGESNFGLHAQCRGENGQVQVCWPAEEVAIVPYDTFAPPREEGKPTQGVMLDALCCHRSGCR